MQSSVTPPVLALAVANWLLRPTASGASRTITGIPCTLGSDPGIVRKENQDRVMIARYRDRRGHPFIVVALADGMGGLSHGTDCAALALGGLINALIDPDAERLGHEERLAKAAVRANDLVHSIFEGGGGCTIVAAFISDSGASCWLSVGDSRVYRRSDKRLAQLSTDDTLAGQLGPRGDGVDSQLLQFLGMGAGIEPHVGRLDTSSGGAVVLTSDGVHFLDQSPYFGQIIASAADGYQTARRLIELAKWCGGPDNATCAVLDVAASLGRALNEAPQHLELHDPFGELGFLPIQALAYETATHGPVPASSDEPGKLEAAPDVPKAAVGSGVSSQKRTKKKRKATAADGGTPKAGRDVQIDLLGKDSE